MEKKTFVITGSTRGIGFGLAKEFLKLGHNVVINGTNQEKLNKVIVELKNINPNVYGVCGSVEFEQTHLMLIETAVENFGKIDIWINNAGIPQHNDFFINIETEKVKNLININVIGLLLGTQLAANHMVNQGYGKIFNMEGFGSDGRMMNKLSLYGTSKRAVNYFTKSVSNELKNKNLQLGVLSPGMVRTDFLNKSRSSYSNEEIKRFNKVYEILAEDVDVVVKFLSGKILVSQKNYDQIKFLSGFKLIFKIMKLMITK